MTVSEKLRLVQGLHSHAEMFGFDWNDDSDWTWHDVACKIADEIDAENDQLRKLVVRMARASNMSDDFCFQRCYVEFGCTDNCAIADALVELGIEVENKEDK